MIADRVLKTIFAAILLLVMALVGLRVMQSGIPILLAAIVLIVLAVDIRLIVRSIGEESKKKTQPQLLSGERYLFDAVEVVDGEILEVIEPPIQRSEQQK